jgi:hypothetical protein
MTALVATQDKGRGSVISSFRALKDIVGLGAVAITLDYYLLNGSCTEFCGHVARLRPATLRPTIIQKRFLTPVKPMQTPHGRLVE